MNYRQAFLLALIVSPSAAAQLESYRYEEFMQTTTAYFSQVQEEALITYFDTADIKTSEIKAAVGPYVQRISDCGYRVNLEHLPHQFFKKYVDRAIEYGDVRRANNDTSAEILEYYQKDGRTLDDATRMFQRLEANVRDCINDTKIKYDITLRGFSERKQVRPMSSVYSGEMDRLVQRLHSLSEKCRVDGKKRESISCEQLSELATSNRPVLERLLNTEPSSNPLLKYRLIVMRAKVRFVRDTVKSLH